MNLENRKLPDYVLCMSKLILYVAVSEDGFIADKDGGVGWLDPFGSEKQDYGYGEFIKSLGALIMGSTTYLQCLSFGDWPYGDIPSIICTHKDLGDAPKESISFAQGDIGSIVKQAKETAGEKDVWLVGGAHLAAQCIEKNLIDQFMIFTMPVKLGEGIALPLPSFESSETHTYDDGIVRIIAPLCNF